MERIRVVARMLFEMEAVVLDVSLHAGRLLEFNILDNSGNNAHRVVFSISSLGVGGKTAGRCFCKILYVTLQTFYFQYITKIQISQ